MSPTRELAVVTLRIFAILMLVWWVLDGAQSLIVGLVAAVLGSALYLALRKPLAHGVRPLAVPRFMVYFLLESVRGGFDVAFRALHRGLPIHPHFFDHRIGLPAGPATVLLISVISLLPGTLSADLSDDGRVVRIHAINEAPAEAVQKLEHRIAELFGLEGGAR